MTKEFNVTEVNGVPVVGEGVGFERIRRITGYLVGTLDRFNNGKRAVNPFLSPTPFFSIFHASSKSAN